jgi:hypothetical protein
MFGDEFYDDVLNIEIGDKLIKIDGVKQLIKERVWNTDKARPIF